MELSGNFNPERSDVAELHLISGMDRVFADANRFIATMQAQPLPR